MMPDKMMHFRQMNFLGWKMQLLRITTLTLIHTERAGLSKMTDATRKTT